MVRRFLCLGAIVLLLLLSIPACGGGSTTRKGEPVPDPDSGARPKPAGRGG
jgi:hypothetical protein